VGLKQQLRRIVERLVHECFGEEEDEEEKMRI